MPTENEELRREIAKWVNDFQSKRGERRLKDEEDVKSAIIEPLLEIFGWDVNEPAEVKKEQPIGSRFADYGLKIDGETKLIIEAKALDKSLGSNEANTLGEYERQAINYAYNKGINWALLTNGEEWRLYNAYWKNRKLAFKTKIGEFPEKEEFSKISLISKENLKKDKPDEYFEDKEIRPDVDEEVTQVLLDCRADITESAFRLNPDKDTEELREGIQTIMDRLLFMKICEDREITKEGQLEQVKEMVDGDPAEETTLSDALTTFAFSRFRKVYDGGLFEEGIADELEISNEALRNIISQLYIYDFSSIDVDILGEIYEDYLGNILNKMEEGGIEWIKDNSERKEHGQFYTPQYIVNHIIENIELEKDSTVLDPACGSGAFLIKTFDKLKEQYIDEEDQDEIDVKHGIATLSNFDKQSEEEINSKILKHNLHGVDLNEEAVELTRINLWLRSIQKDIELNRLDNNIKTGDSLVFDEKDEAAQFFGDEVQNFNYEEEFSEVINEGGFDVIIGNPPWGSDLDDAQKEYLSQRYNLDKQNLNIFECFIHLSLELLNENGQLGFLVPKNFIRSSQYEDTRQKIAEETKIQKITDFSKFPEVTQECIALIVEKSEEENLRENKVDLGDRKVPQEVFIDARGHVFNLNLDMNKFELIKKIENQESELNEFIETSRGEEISKNGYIIKCSKCGAWNKDSKKETKKCESCMNKFVVDDAERKSLIQDSGRPFLTGENVEKFSLDTSKYLPETPPKGIEYKEDSIYKPPKLVMMAVNEELVVGYSENHSMFTKNIYSILPREGTSEEDLRKIEGLLNSELYEFFHRNTYTLGAEYTIYIPQSYIRSLSVPDLDDLPDEISHYVERLEKLRSEKKAIDSSPRKLFRKYGGSNKAELGDIIDSSSFVNEIETSSSANIKDIKASITEDVLTIGVKVYDGWRDALKFELDDKNDREYLKLYLNSLNDSEISSDKPLCDKVKQIEIPDWSSTEVKRKITGEYRELQEEIERVEKEIEEFKTKLNNEIFEFYKISETERASIRSELENLRSN